MVELVEALEVGEDLEEVEVVVLAEVLAVGVELEQEGE